MNINEANKKILIIKTSSMGDIINTLPAITDAANALPTAEFDWVIEKNFAQIPTWHPKIKKIIPVHFRLWKKKYYSLTSYKEYFKFIKELKKKQYDIIIDAQGLIKSSFFITYFTIGQKHGMNFKSVREPIASLCYDKRHNIPKTQHTIERIRQLFSHSLQYPLPKNKGQYHILQNFQKKAHKNPYLIFLCHTTNTKKHWPEHHWRNLIKKTINIGYQIKLTYWSKHEKLRIQRLISGFENHNHITILHQLTLTEIAKQIASAHAIISVDTGLSHLATALFRPNITLYGPTDPKLTGIYNDNQQSSIIYSKTKKMKNITTTQVWNKLINLINKK